jgi:hypothetical protein
MDHNRDRTSDLNGRVPAAGPRIGVPRPRPRPSMDVSSLASIAVAMTGLVVTGLNHPGNSSVITHQAPEQIGIPAGNVCNMPPLQPHFSVDTPSVLLRFGEPLDLGLTIDGTNHRAQLVICGFAPGSLFLSGRALDRNAWIIPAPQTQAAIMAPPQSFAGIMDITIALVLPDGNIADRRTVHAKWMPPASTPERSVTRRINPSDVNALLQRGNALKATGDLAGARLLFGRAAEAGDARAAFSYAETYDPIVLENRGEVGLASNVAIARIWYGKARDRGSLEALERLERLARWLTFPKAVAASP